MFPTVDNLKYDQLGLADETTLLTMANKNTNKISYYFTS